jgi:hypothetical protein
MDDTDCDIIAHLLRDEDTVGCPLCTWTYRVPPGPPSAAAILRFSLSTDPLAAGALQQARAHLDKHTLADWLNAIGRGERR